MKGITELKPEYKNCSPGYRVRLRYCNGTPQIQQTFLDSKYGSHEKAHSAAKVFVMLIEKRLPTQVSRTRTKPTVRSKSGIVGVHRARQYSGSKGKKKALDCFSWVASWYEDGKLKTKSYGETKWGAEVAKQMAIEMRKSKEAVILGSAYCPYPEEN